MLYGYKPRTIVDGKIVEVSSNVFNFGYLGDNIGIHFPVPEVVPFEDLCRGMSSMISSYFWVIESIDPSDIPRRKTELISIFGLFGKAIFNSLGLATKLDGYETIISNKINFSDVMEELPNVYKRHFIDLSFIESFIEVIKERLDPYLKEEVKEDDRITKFIMMDAEANYLNAIYEEDIEMWWSRILNACLLNMDIYANPSANDVNPIKQLCYIEQYFKRNKKTLPRFNED